MFALKLLMVDMCFCSHTLRVEIRRNKIEMRDRVRGMEK